MLPRAVPPRALAVAVVAVAAGALVLVGAPAAADVDDFEFESMSVDFTLSRDPDGTSRLRAVETLVALFPEFDQNRGIVRDIPAEIGRVDIGLDVVSVTDGSGAPVPYEESRWTDYTGVDFVSLALGTDEFVHGRTTYVIEWTARDVIRTFDSGQEFYWDVNGTGWRVPFQAVSATLHLSPEVAATATGASRCFAGYEGESDSCRIAASDDGFATDPVPLNRYENVSIVVGFDTGTFRAGTPVENTWPFTVLPWVLLGLLAAAALTAFLLRRLLWTHAAGRGIIVPEYEGPEELGVMAAAELLGRSRSALPAQLVKLAVDGVVRLVEDVDQPEHRRYRLDIVDRSAAQQPDQRALDRLTGGKVRDGDTLVLDRFNRTLGDRVSTLSALAQGSLRPRYVSRGERSPLRRLIFWPAMATLAGGVLLIVLCGAEDVGSPLLSLSIPVLLVGSLVVMGFSGKPERRTAAGTAAYEQLRGLREYLTLAEADRLRVLQSPQGAVRTPINPDDAAAVVRLYERLLPWAIVFGVEKEWEQVLAAHYSETVPPATNLGFVAGIAGMADIRRSFAASSFATTPPVRSSSSGSGGSSSSSGFSSGGGFSGGGGGGGGGGGR